MNICLSDFSGADDLARFRAAFAVLKANPGSTLTVPPGVYGITSPLARKAQSDVMTGALGGNPEPTMFSPTYIYERGLDFDGHDGSTVLADGVTLLIDGFMEPVSIRNCRHITVRGLTVDHRRKPYSKGIIESYEPLDGGKGRITVRYGEEYPLFPGTGFLRHCAYDTGLHRYKQGLSIAGGGREMLAPQLWRYVTDRGDESFVGCELYIWHTYHSRPAVLIENAFDTTLRDITINSQPGMGITAQHATDILIERLSVVPSVGEHMSTNTDATHFASCRGRLRLDGCVFEGQGDDSTNVHTYYHRLEKIDGARCLLRCPAPTGTHSCTLDYPELGDTLQLSDPATLCGGELFRVVTVAPDFAAQTCAVTLDRDLPANAGSMVFSDLDALPYLEFVNCRMHSHYARAVLIKCRRALVENCTFSYIFESAIRIAAEAGWAEGIPVEDVTIRRCRVINCGGGFDIRMDTDVRRPSHGRVTIEDCVIDCPKIEHGITLHDVREACVRRNSIISRGAPVEIGDGVRLI